MRSVRLSLSILVMGFLTTTSAFSQWTAPWEYFRNTPIPIHDFGTVTSTITVPDNFNVQDLAVMVNIHHSKASDLRITLKDPAGLIYTLSEYNGGFDMFNGAPFPDFRYTIFDNNPTTPYGAGLPGTAITDAVSNQSPLFRGIFMPESVLPTGVSGNGSWTLEVYDNLLGNTGTLASWGLIFNRYDFYKDVRVGGAIQLVPGIVPDRWAPPYIDDMTTIPQYTVHGHRPLNGLLNVRYLNQNSKTTSATAMTWKVTPPGGGLITDVRPDVTLGVGMFQNFGTYAITKKGQYTTEFSMQQRSDIWQTRDDNSRMDLHKVTPASLGWDNGDASTITDITAFQNECNGAFFQIYADQMFTSVDIWHSDAVELEPFPTPGYGSIRVYDNNLQLLHNFGPYDLPRQGNKWVSYPVPPTMLPTGSYFITVCVDNMPMVGSTGFGVDLEGSPFVPGSAIQRYYGNGVQVFSFDDGNSWFENFDASFGTFMLRPNFIFNNSDVGVIAFEQPTGNIIFGGFTPQVRFGSFSHNPQLPNLLTVGKVSVIDNSNGSTIAVTEKRMFFGPSNYETVVTFDPIAGLPSGTYTLRAEVWRADDENDINNVYERTYTVNAAPVVVSYNSKVSREKLAEITARLTEQGLDVETFDRTFEPFNFNKNANVIWAGSVTNAEGQAMRQFVESGNYLAVVSEDTKGDIRTNLFAEVAENQERETMDAIMSKKLRSQDVPSPDYTLAHHILNGGIGNDLMKNDGGSEDRIIDYVGRMLNRIEVLGEPEQRPDRNRQRNHRASQDIAVVGSRLGNLAVAQIVSNNSVETLPAVPVALDETSFELAQNFPNPFNPTTTIYYNVATESNVTLRVYDLLGRQVATLVNTIQNSGLHTVAWDAATDAGVNVSSGIYVYRMEAMPLDGSAPSIMTKKMILSR